MKILIRVYGYFKISTLTNAEEIWSALVNEFGEQTIFDKMHCLHDLFFLQLEGDSEEKVRKYLNFKVRKFSESERLHLNLPKEMLPWNDHGKNS